MAGDGAVGLGLLFETKYELKPGFHDNQVGDWLKPRRAFTKVLEDISQVARVSRVNS